METKQVLSEKKKRIIVYLAAVLVVFIWLPLSITKAVAYDQAYTTAMVRHSFGEIVTLCSYDVHSPLYYFIAKIFYHLCFNHIFGLKVCSLFFMGIYLWMLAVPFRKEFGNRMAFSMIVLSGVLPTFLTHNTEPRMYTMAISAYAAVAFLAYKIIKRFQMKYAVLFFFASVFAVYIHTYTMIATVLLYLVLMVASFVKKEERKKRIAWFFINGVLVSVSYLPWLFALMSQFGTKGEVAKPQFDVAFYIDEILNESFSSIMYPKKWQTAIWLVILAFSLVILIVKKTPYWKEILTGAGIFVLVSALGVYLSVSYSPCFMGRYVTCIMPLILFAVAAALDLVKPKWIVAAILLLAVMGGALVYRDRVRYEYEKGLDNYLEYAKNTYKEEDAVIYADIHSNYLSVFTPDVYTYILGRKDEFNPYDNDEIFADPAQADDVKGDLYFICLNDKNPDWFIVCNYEQVYGFHYLYYDFAVYKINFQTQE